MVDFTKIIRKNMARPQTGAPAPKRAAARQIIPSGPLSQIFGSPIPQKNDRAETPVFSERLGSIFGKDRP